MAKIYGFELKGLKRFQGTDGYGFSANLYLNGKKIGEVIDSANGSEVDVSFDYKLSDEARDEIDNRIEQYYKDYPKHMYYDNKYAKRIEIIEELYTLKERESSFKKSIKKGAMGIVLLSFSKRNEKMDLDNYKSDDMYTFYNIPSVDALIKEEKPVESYIYKDISDFIIQSK